MAGRRLTRRWGTMEESKLKLYFKVMGAGALLLASPVAGAAVVGAAVFFIAYFICRAVVWMTGDISEMNWMWLLLVIEPLAMIVGFVLGPLCFTLFVDGISRNRADRPVSEA